MVQRLNFEQPVFVPDVRLLSFGFTRITAAGSTGVGGEQVTEKIVERHDGIPDVWLISPDERRWLMVLGPKATGCLILSMTLIARRH